MTDYNSFVNFLNKQSQDKTDCTLLQIESILGRSLSPSAYKYPAWWSNSPTHPLMKEVLEAGWRSSNINLKEKIVSFYKGVSKKIKTKKTDKKIETFEISKETKAIKSNNQNKICVITACGNKKESTSLPAWKIYKSTRIKAVHKRKKDEDMYILSAEHGLLPSEKIIKPYNRLMDEKRAQELIPKIESIIKKYDKIIYFKAGARKLYEDCLNTACKKTGVEMESFGFGFMGGINELENRINAAKGNKIKKKIIKEKRENHPQMNNCEWLHNLLEDLPLVRYPFDIEKLPDNGVYFFYEKGELNGHNSKNKPRIIRVGTHREGNFKSRMKDHFIFNDSKMDFNQNQSPPHDRSIFRTNLGRAILNKRNSEYLKIWNTDFTTKKNREELSHLRNIEFEKEIETEVTKLLHEDFSFKFLIAEGEEGRIGSKGIESKLIGTLSHCEKCTSSKNWLGNHSPVSKIQNSGLWLYQHLSDDPISESNKTELLELVKITKKWINLQLKQNQKRV